MIESGLYPRQHSRPGDRRRRGFVESQGGGSFVICRGSVALALGLPVRAVVGYAASFGDGIHTSIPAPGSGRSGSVRGGVDSPLGRALAALGLTADDVAVVSKHDTSTEANDPNEAFIHETIQQALGRTPGAPLRVISQKSLTGHSKGGAAAWQMAGLCDVFDTGDGPGQRQPGQRRPAGDPRGRAGRGLPGAAPARSRSAPPWSRASASATCRRWWPWPIRTCSSRRSRPSSAARTSSAPMTRRVAGARARLGAAYGGDARCSSGAPTAASARARPTQLREREAGMLLDPAGSLPGLAGA